MDLLPDAADITDCELLNLSSFLQLLLLACFLVNFQLIFYHPHLLVYLNNSAVNDSISTSGLEDDFDNSGLLILDLTFVVEFLFFLLNKRLIEFLALVNPLDILLLVLFLQLGLLPPVLLFVLLFFLKFYLFDFLFF